MAPSFGRRCACGALIIAVVAGGLQHHDPHTHVETFQPTPAWRAAAGLSTSSASAVSGDGFGSTGAI